MSIGQTTGMCWTLYRVRWANECHCLYSISSLIAQMRAGSKCPRCLTIPAPATLGHTHTKSQGLKEQLEYKGNSPREIAGMPLCLEGLENNTIYVLHSQIDSTDRSKVLPPCPVGCLRENWTPGSHESFPQSGSPALNKLQSSHQSSPSKHTWGTPWQCQLQLQLSYQGVLGENTTGHARPTPISFPDDYLRHFLHGAPWDFPAYTYFSSNCPGPDLCGALWSHLACTCFNPCSLTKESPVWSALGYPTSSLCLLQLYLFHQGTFCMEYPGITQFVPPSALAIPPRKTWYRMPMESQLTPAI